MSEVVEKSLPENWKWATLGDVATLLRGVNYKKNDASKEPEAGKLPVLRANNIGQGLNFNDLVYVPERLIKDEQHIKKGDIIIAMSSGSKHLVGKAAQANDDFNGGYGAFCANLRVTSDIESKYVAYYYSSQDNRRRLSASSKGSNINNLKREHVLDAPIPIAPPKQQKRIVAKIEEFFSHIDAGIEALKKAQKLLKQYRQSVLKAAVTGELTKEWREANKGKLEPASQLLERILKERRQKWEEQQLKQFQAKGKMPKGEKWKGKYKEPLSPEFEHINDVPGIPESWEWVTVSQLTSFVKDGPHYSPKYAEKGIPFITGGNVRSNGVDFESCKYITKELHEELSRRCKPVLNDILYTKGGTTGIARVNTYDFDFNVWVHVAVLRLVNINFIKPFYIQHALNSVLCYFQSQKYTHGVGNQDLGLTRMIKICLALPPVEEQKKIIKIIDNKMQSISRVEEKVEHMLMMAEKNKQSILTSAFSGRI